jgi:hypothetical protein
MLLQASEFFWFTVVAYAILLVILYPASFAQLLDLLIRGSRGNFIVIIFEVDGNTKILKAHQIIAHHNSIFGGRFAKLKKADEIDFRKL